MRGRSRFISDMAQVANGAASALDGIREELDNIVKQRTERGRTHRALSPRRIRCARTRHDAMAARVAELKAGWPRPARPQRHEKGSEKAASTRRKDRRNQVNAIFRRLELCFRQLTFLLWQTLPGKPLFCAISRSYPQLMCFRHGKPQNIVLKGWRGYGIFEITVAEKAAQWHQPSHHRTNACPSYRPCIALCRRQDWLLRQQEPDARSPRSGALEPVSLAVPGRTARRCR